MRELAIALSLGLLSGCTLILQPNRDLDREDAGPDAGDRVDAGPDAGPDAGDAGFDGGCPGSIGIESSCTNGVDDDCNGLTDCEDRACRYSGVCCVADDPQPWPFAGAFTNGRADGSMTLDVQDTTIDFGLASWPQAVVYETCAPLAFGMDLQVNFVIGPGLPQGNYAALKLSPVNTRAGMGEYLSELTVRVVDDGEIRLERAGTLVASMDRPELTTVPIRVGLRPGLDAAQGAALLVTVEVDEDFLVRDQALIPISLLRGAEPMCGMSGAEICCEPDGLFIIVEGQGPNVTAMGGVTALTFDCENPNQFLPETSIGIGDDLSDHFEPNTTGNWRAGGVGEPSVAHMRRAGTELLELWGDTAALERDSDDLRVVDFVVGATQLRSSWTPRLLDRTPDEPRLLGPIVREPSIGAPRNEIHELEGSYLLAVARQRTPSELYDIHVGRITQSEPANPRFPSFDEPVLEPVEHGCTSLRDPSVVPLELENEFTDALLFFTCERNGPPSIGVARIVYQDPRYRLEGGSIDVNVITTAVGDYGVGGVSSPEAIAYPIGTSGDVGIRLWFLSKDGRGEVAVSTATGVLSSSERLPTLSPYPANPVLRATDPLLGGTCTGPADCSIDALAVTRTAPMIRWDPSYLVVVAHTRQTMSGPEHVLVPLLQPRPEGE